jgi:hypothetical protein
MFANSFAYPIRFLDDVSEEVSDVVRDVLDNGEDLFQNISHEVRNWESKVVCQLTNVLRKLLGDPSVEDAFFAATMVAGRAVLASSTSAAGRATSLSSGWGFVARPAVFPLIGHGFSPSRARWDWS